MSNLLMVLVFTLCTMTWITCSDAFCSGDTRTPVGWLGTRRRKQQFHQRTLLSSPHSSSSSSLDPHVVEKFRILTCCSTSCSRKRHELGLGEFATYALLWEKGQALAPEISIEETPCLGACQQAPCVAIEHEDYEGTVALEGMEPDEFEKRVFYNIVDEEDGDRVWSCLENAIQILQSEEET